MEVYAQEMTSCPHEKAIRAGKADSSVIRCYDTGCGLAGKLTYPGDAREIAGLAPGIGV